MAGSSFNIHIGATADLAALQGVTREINAAATAASAQDRLAQKLAQHEFNRLTTAGQIARLKEREQQLLRAAFDKETSGDAEGAAKLNLAALENREKIEQLLTQQKREQLALATQQAQKDKEVADTSARAENERQARLEGTRQKLAQLQRQQRQEAFAALPPAEQLNRLVAQRETLQRKINEHGDRYRRNQQTQLAVQLRLAELDAQIRSAQARAAAAQGPGIGGQLKGALGGVAAQFAAGFGIQAVVGKALGSARELFTSADLWSDMADRIGVTTETVQEFEIAANKSGASLQDVALAFRGVRSAQARAQGGNEEMVKSFKALGFTADEVKTLSPEQIFRRIADESSKGGQGVLQTRAAMDLLGRNSDRILTAFRSGFTDAARNAREAGAIIEDDIVRSLDQAQENSALLGKQLKAAFAPMVSFFAGIFTAILNGFRTVGTFVGTFFGSLFKDISWADLLNPLAMASNLQKMAANASTALDDATNQTAAELNRQEKERVDKARPDADKEQEADRNQRILALQEQLRAAEAETADAALSKEEKVARLKERQLELQRQISAEVDEERRLELQLEERGIARQLAAERAKQPESAGRESGLSPRPNADQLLRLGGFRAGGPQLDRQVSLLTQQVRLLQALERAQSQTRPVRIVR